ncbi:hypothetical protein BJV78DRAFT_417431 [Lactifluus subvellereus]|nr:hypothetical protein BJV78DRAFT_417431 [Lactifluus subvellereus]
MCLSCPDGVSSVLGFANNAVRSAAHAGEKVTHEANERFELAVQALDIYEKIFVRRRYKSIIEIMKQAEWNDAWFLQSRRSHLGRDKSPVSRTPVNFVIFRTLPDPKPTIIRRKYRRTKLVFYCLIHVLEMLVSRSDVSETLWNFSCFGILTDVSHYKRMPTST